MSTTARPIVSRDGTGRVTIAGRTIGYVQPRDLGTSRRTAHDYWVVAPAHQPSRFDGYYTSRREAVTALAREWGIVHGTRTLLDGQVVATIDAPTPAAAEADYRESIALDDGYTVQLVVHGRVTAEQTNTEE